MYTRTITYTDYNGNERTENFMFNLNESELTTMEMSHEGGLQERLKTMIDRKDAPLIMKTFREMLHMAYGEKSPDGRRFIKSDELSTAFEQTEAYNILFMELCTDSAKASKFIGRILPESLQKREENKPELPVVKKSTQSILEEDHQE